MYTKEEFREFASFVKKSTTDKKAAIAATLFVVKNEDRFNQMYEFMKANPQATFNEINYKEGEIVLEECIKEQGEK